MNGKIIRLFLMLGLVIGIGATAHAKTSSKLNIPFDFMVNGKLMKAGNYELKFGISDSDPKTFLLRSTDGKNTVLVSQLIDKRNSGAADVRMIFEKNGDAYTLTAINSPRVSVELLNGKGSVTVSKVEINTAQ